jgi:hypothetical protein
MKKKSERYEKVLHPRMPDKLYVHLLRTAADWGILGDTECAAWFIHELEVRNYQCAKAEFETMRRNTDLLKHYKGLPCIGCGKPSNTIDHIIPLSKGGTNDPSNLQPMCSRCNSRKADKV